MTADAQTDQDHGGAGDATDLSGAEGWRPRDPAVPMPAAPDLDAVREMAPSLARDSLAVPGVLVIAGTFVLATPAGVVPAAAVVGLWALTSPIYAATAGVLFVGTLDLSLSSQLLVGGGAVAVLLSPLLRYRPRAPPLAGATLVAVLTAAIVYRGVQAGMVGLTATGLVAVVALAAYGLHRYSLLVTVYRDST